VYYIYVQYYASRLYTVRSFFSVKKDNPTLSTMIWHSFGGFQKQLH
jgi:hypothetical protein